MIKIRHNIFETNSSSTNSLVLGTEQLYYNKPEKLRVLNLNWDSRDFDYTQPDEKFTVLVSLCDNLSELYRLCYKIYQLGIKEIVLPHPSTFKDDPSYVTVGEIDESKEELRDIMNDTNKLELFLFGNSYIHGEDNNYMD